MWRNLDYRATKQGSMARQIPEDELEAIIEALAKHGRPASIAEIAVLLPMNMPRRTLQRRVAVLADQGRLQQEGQARASRYGLPENKGRVIRLDVTESFAASEPLDVQLPISGEGQALRSVFVRRFRCGGRSVTSAIFWRAHKKSLPVVKNLQAVAM
jgi:hypothetical protein